MTRGFATDSDYWGEECCRRNPKQESSMPTSDISEGATSPTARGRPPIRIPDHELIRRIDGGSYGDVWLARNVMGTFRAIKIILHKALDERSFEREFAGIRISVCLDLNYDDILARRSGQSYQRSSP